MSEIKKFANRLCWTDIEPCEVVKVVSDRCVEIREMKTVQTKFPNQFSPGGFSGHYADNRGGQAYDYFPDPEAPAFRIRLHKNGQWKDKGGQKYGMSDNPFKFYDYNF